MDKMTCRDKTHFCSHKPGRRLGQMTFVGQNELRRDKMTFVTTKTTFVMKTMTFVVTK